MCVNCGCPTYVPCNCYPYTSSTCCPTGCPIQLDTSCVIYHKNNNQTSGLVGLQLGNGSTLELILDSIDVKLRGLNVADWTLAYLRAGYTINTLQQLAEAVDQELSDLNDRVTALEP